MTAYRKDILENGSTLVMESHANVRGISVGVWVRVGSAFENPKQNGISHFIEHMLFKGTESRSPVQIAAFLESLGGELNAFTEREYTCYHATVLKEHLDQSLEILSDILLHSVFIKGELERERKVLVQEMAMSEETPEDWILTLLFKSVWAKDPMGLPILGSRKTVQSLTRRHLLKFFEDYYRPDNLVISIAGDLEFDKVREKVEKYFSFSRNQKALKLPKLATKFKSRRKSHVMETEQLHLILAFESVGMKDPQRFEALFLSYYLGGGMSSCLFQEIREKAALAYNIDCDALPYSDEGLITTYLATGHRSLKKCLSIIGREIEKIATKPLSEESLLATKGQLKGIILLSSDYMESRQESIGRNEMIFGRYIPLEESIAAIEAVTAENVQGFAEKIFCKERESAVTIARKRYKSSELTLFK